MEFEKFKKCIDTINNTHEKQDLLSKCMEENLSTSTYCIVDICNDVIKILIDLLADYYDCNFEIQDVLDNDISWWLYEEVEKVIYVKENGKERKIPVPDTYSFWKYLEDNRKKKCNKKGKKKKNAK